MEKITDFNKFMELWNISHKNRYWGNKKITLEQEQAIIEKANQNDFKRYNIYILKDGYHFIVIDTNWAIDSTLYYDDEQDAPKVTFEYFKARNQFNRKYSKLEEAGTLKPYFMINYNGNDKEVTISRSAHLSDYQTNLQWAQSKNYFVNFMDDEDIKEYNLIVDNLNALYNERLEKYFRKYNKNIHAVGYWVNR